MTEPDMQYFSSSGTWVKPPGASTTDVVLRANGGGEATVTADDMQGPVYVRGGRYGQVMVLAIPASLLPAEATITITPGELGGQAGYALFVTHYKGEGASS